MGVGGGGDGSSSRLDVPLLKPSRPPVVGLGISDKKPSPGGSGLPGKGGGVGGEGVMAKEAFGRDVQGKFVSVWNKGFTVFKLSSTIIWQFRLPSQS